MGSYPSSVSTGGGSFIVTGTSNDTFRLFTNGIFRAYGSFVYAQNRIRMDDDTEFTIIDCDAELEDGVSVGEGGSAFGARQQITYDRTRVHHTGAVGIKLYSFNSGANAASYSLNGTRVEKCKYGFQLGDANNLSPILKDVEIDTCTNHIVPNLGNANVTFVNPDFTALRGALINSSDITTIAFRCNFKVQNASNVAIQNAKVYIVDGNNDVVVNSESTDAGGLINSHLFDYDGDICLRNSTFAGNTKTNREDHARSVYKYGFLPKTDTITIDQDTKDFVALLPDANITEANKTTVNAYTEIDTSAKFYDKASSYLEDNFGTYLDFIVTRSGNLIDAGSYNVTIDATAASAFNVTGNLITIKASTFTGNINTTGTFTLSNGAVLDGVLNGVLNVNNGDVITEDIDGAFVVDTDTVTSFTIDGFIPTNIQTTGTGSVTIIGINNAKLTTTNITGTGTLVRGDGLNPSSNWAVVSDVITLSSSTTETDLLGLRGLGIVDYSKVGSSYTYVINGRMEIRGALTISPESEQLVFPETQPTPQALLLPTNGELTVGDTSSAPVYPKGTWLRVTRRGSKGWASSDNFSVRVTGGTINLYGGSMSVASPFRFDSGTFNSLEQEIILLPSLDQNARFLARAATNLSNLDIYNNGIDIGNTGAGATFNNILIYDANPIGIHPCYDQMELVNYDYVVGGAIFPFTSSDADSKTIFARNFAKGTSGGYGTSIEFGTSTTLSDIVLELSKDLAFNFKATSGASLQGVKLYSIERDNSGTSYSDWSQDDDNRVVTLNGVNYTTPLATNATSDVNGDITLDNFRFAIAYQRNAGVREIRLCRFTKSADDTDVHDFLFCSYNSLLSSTDIGLQQTGTKNTDWILVADLSITETNRTTVQAYTLLNTAQQAYDFAKSYLYDNYAGELATIIGRSGNQVELGGKALVINATASTVFAYSNPTITIKASTYTGGATATTGTVTTTNGALLNGGTFDCDVNYQSGAGTTITGVTINGTLDFNTAGTYTLDACTVAQVTNSSGGAVNISLANNATVTTNTGPNVNIEQAVTISTPSIINGSRVQLYNVTKAAALDNSLVSGGAGYSFDVNLLGSTADSGDVIRIRATYAVGAVAKIEATATGVLSASGLSFLLTQSDDTTYNTLAIDGSSVTGFSADYVDDEVDITVASNFSLASLYAWWVSNLTTEQGISDFFGGLVAEDVANFKINNSVVDVFLDNTTTTEVFATDNRRLYRVDGARPVKSPTSGGGGIDVEWRERVLIAESGVSGLTSTESAALLALPSAQDNADSVWDSANAVDVVAIKAKTDQLNFTGNDVQSVASNMRGTDGANTVAPDNTNVAAIKAKTDQLNFTGNDVQSVASNMRGTDNANTVAPDNANITDIKAKTDQLNFTGNDVQSVASNMRGTDNANTVAPDNTNVAAIKAKTDQLNFTGNDVQSVASNMRGTDNANTVAPDNTNVAAIKTKTDQLNFSGNNVQSVSSTPPDNASIAAIKIQTDKLNFSGNDVQSVASNMRGTDGANTVAPNNNDITSIKTKTDQLNFSGNDVQSVASNMRGTDGANTVAPDNTGINTKLTDIQQNQGVINQGVKKASKLIPHSQDVT
jgi:hypothetical protein